MLIEKDIHKILSHLAGHESVQISFDGSEIFIRFMEAASKLSLTTVVYNGGNYIPSSVRSCVSHKAPIFQASIPTFLTLDEPHFQIQLNYIGTANETLSYVKFKELLEEFGFMAEKWRNYLDEHDKNDLVYVRVKS